MKKLLFTLLFGINVLSLFANNHSDWIYAEVQSKEEQNQNGSFNVNVNLNFSEDVTLEGNFEAALLPQGFSFTPVSAAGQYFAGNTITIPLTVNYNASSLPFYTEELIFTTQVKHGQESQSLFVRCMVYFTPYGSAEIWNYREFQSLKRSWYRDTQTPRQRKNILKSSIPVSNLPDNYLDSIPDS